MSSTASSGELLKPLKFVAVPGKPNMVILSEEPEADEATEPEPMTVADWDKFEADINEAFEQVP